VRSSSAAQIRQADGAQSLWETRYGGGGESARAGVGADGVGGVCLDGRPIESTTIDYKLDYIIQALTV